ncbi:MAG: M56 family metallopeptidase [Mycobacteriales bacterium]
MLPALALALLAALTGVAMPRLLTRLPLDRAPRLGVVLWQATGLATLLAGALALAALAVPLPALSSDLGRTLQVCVMALQEAYRSPAGHAIRALAGVSLLLVIGRIAFGLWASLRRAAQLRSRHRDLLALVAVDVHGLGNAVMVDHPAPLAYCVPGRHATIVLTAGALRALDRDELQAVVAHERAHLAGRHAWVLSGVEALATSLPFVPAFTVARAEVAQLLEMLADDAAGQRHGGIVVASALLTLGRSCVPAGTLGASDTSGGQRARRLLAGAPRLPLAAGIAGYLAATLLIAAPVAVIAAPAAAAATRNYCPIHADRVVR